MLRDGALRPPKRVSSTRAGLRGHLLSGDLAPSMTKAAPSKRKPAPLMTRGDVFDDPASPSSGDASVGSSRSEAVASE